jgi:hypothetical protein
VFEPHVVDEDSVVTGALFLGDGRFRYVPPLDVERRQLRLLAGAESLDVSFGSMYLRFSSDLLVEWLPNLQFGREHKDPRADDRQRFCENFIDPTTALAVLESLAQRESPGFLYAQLGPLNQSIEPYVYTFDPSRSEEVRLERRVGERAEHRIETYTSHRPLSAYSSGSTSYHRTSTRVRPLHYEIDCELASKSDGRNESLDVIAVQVAVEAITDLHTLLSFRLPGSVRVTSISFDGTPCDFEHLSGTNVVCVPLPRSVSRGERLSLRVEYEGHLVGRFGSGVFLREPWAWYPKFDSDAPSTFDIGVSYPYNRTVLAVGTKTQVGSSYRFRTKQPVKVATFSLGTFSTYSYVSPVDTLPSVTVHALEDRTEFEWFDHSFGIANTADVMDEGVAHDVADATKFLSWLFGKCPVDTLVVTEVPYFMSVSYPELVHFSWVAFTRYRGQGGEEAHRAHEVAHQWFGHGVRPKTYHDRWISEGFCEFAGYWYAGWAMKNDGITQQLIRTARDQLLDNCRGFFRSRKQVAALWQGPRTSTSKTDDDYWILVYEKGAFVLHMLRCMLQDLQSGSDKEFVAMMREFYRVFEGKEVSTEEFASFVSEWTGMDMDWFFDQWVFGTEIPRYDVDARWSTRPDGTYLVEVDVEQKEVSPGFRTYVTVRIDLVDDRSLRTRVNIEGASSSFAFAVPAEPSGFRFNDDESVLAEVRQSFRASR